MPAPPEKRGEESPELPLRHRPAYRLSGHLPAPAGVAQTALLENSHRTRVLELSTVAPPSSTTPRPAGQPKSPGRPQKERCRHSNAQHPNPNHHRHRHRHRHRPEPSTEATTQAASSHHPTQQHPSAYPNHRGPRPATSYPKPQTTPNPNRPHPTKSEVPWRGLRTSRAALLCRPYGGLNRIAPARPHRRAGQRSQPGAEDWTARRHRCRMLHRRTSR